MVLMVLLVMPDDFMILLSSLGLMTLSGNWRWNIWHLSFRVRAACSYKFSWFVMKSISYLVAVHKVTLSDRWICFGFSFGGCKLSLFSFSKDLKCYLIRSLSCYSGNFRSLAIRLIGMIDGPSSSFLFVSVS